MNIASIQAMVEELNEQERHQFYAGAQRGIIATNNSLRKRMARAERMIETGISETEIKLELERKQRCQM